MKAINTPGLIEYINSLNPSVKIELECPQCDCLFTRNKNVIQSKFGPGKLQKFMFCSYSCAMLYQTTSQKINCSQCDKLFIRHKNQINKSINHFCSRSCSASYNNTHKKTGFRRSRLEKWIEINLTDKYPHLDIIYNNKMTINSELDIYIPKYKLAIELNGILHYKPIYGNKKLLLIQNNDSLKLKKCIENNIDLIIIDVSSQNHFDLKSSKEYLDKILNIINLKQRLYH
jgi:uncharacterized C2H2 Zn-finger protein